MSLTLGRGGFILALAAVFPSLTQAADAQQIEQAVARGVAHIKQAQLPDGSFSHANPAGLTALAALALLESGVHANDPAIQRAAAYLRKESLAITHTYSLSASNLFFDRLGDSGDVALIESITLRLLQGQSSRGGWTYLCPTISEAEMRRLSDHLGKQAQMTARAEPPPKRTPSDLSKEIRDQLARMTSWQPGRAEIPFGLNGGQAALMGRDDNSNTQFAILALWVSRRHGLPVDPALARAERHFRRTQNADGGWGYLTDMFLGRSSSPAMTCAGLLGLAMGYGATGEAVLRTDVSKPVGKTSPKPSTRNVATDRAVRDGLALLATAVGSPRGRRLGAIPPELIDPAARPKGDYYFMWSLERVAMIYDLNTLGKKDWYAWGAELILDHQAVDGSWSGKHPGADTCFALLFLCRSNLAKDLTASMRGKLRDAGEVQLKAKGFPKDMDTNPSTASSAKPPNSAEKVAIPPVQPEPKPSVPAPASDAFAQEVQRLSSALVDASAASRKTMLTELVESKGPAYTEALAAAIPRLTGEAKDLARDGLAKRLARMTPATLRDKLKEDNVEVRRAAALAVELKGDRQLIPDLIALLGDSERTVTRAAHAALREMAGQDHGPTADPWKAWWARQKP